jgi:hypothetical protein
VDRTQRSSSTPLTFSPSYVHTTFFPHPFIYTLPIRTPFIFSPLLSMPPGKNKTGLQCSCSCDQLLYFPGTWSSLPMSARVLLGNLPFYFQVRIGPEALQLSKSKKSTHVVTSRGRTRLRSAAAYIIFSGLDASTPPPPQPPSPPAQHQVHWKPGTDNTKLKNLDPSSGLSRPDSSLESLAAIPALDYKQCNFRASAAAAVINGLICYFPAGGPFRLRGKNVNSCLVDIRHIFKSGVQG